MTIKPSCNRCGNELADFGGLLFSPPNAEGFTKKWHLCKPCYAGIVKNFKK